MNTPAAGPPDSKPAHRPPWWAVASALAVVAALALGGWLLWPGKTHKVSQAAAKDEVSRILDAMVQGIGAGRQDYTSGVVLQHCEDGTGGYDGWQVYSQGEFQHQNRASALAMAGAMNAYLGRAGYSNIKQTVDAHTVRVAGVKNDIEAALLYDSSSSSPLYSQMIRIGATTRCDIVPDPAVATSDVVKIG